jgi:hypothetical protein
VRPRILLTRRWPEAVELYLAKRFDVTFNAEDRVLEPDELRTAVSMFDAIRPTIGDHMSAEGRPLPE